MGIKQVSSISCRAGLCRTARTSVPCMCLNLTSVKGTSLCVARTPAYKHRYTHLQMYKSKCTYMYTSASIHKPCTRLHVYTYIYIDICVHACVEVSDHELPSCSPAKHPAGIKNASERAHLTVAARSGWPVSGLENVSWIRSPNPALGPKTLNRESLNL